jgi:hypothetical protein
MKVLFFLGILGFLILAALSSGPNDPQQNQTSRPQTQSSPVDDAIGKMTK